MYVRNFLNAGDYLIPIPVGLPLTVQYDESGRFKKVLSGYNDAAKRLPDAFSNQFAVSNLVPNKIGVSGGTTWVTGVLYTPKQFKSEGELPKCIEDDIVKDFSTSSSTYSFKAVGVKSTGTLFSGAGPIRQWLNMSGFTTLPGFLMPANITRKSFYQLVSSKMYTFKYPSMIYYVIYRGTDVIYYPLVLNQVICTKITNDLQSNGRIVSTIHSNYKDIQVSYADILKYNVNPGTLVMFDSTNRIIRCELTDDKKREKRKDLICSICHKPIKNNDDMTYYCDNSSCMSTKYPNWLHFCKVHDLPILPFDEYLKCIKNGEILILSDILDIEYYTSATINTSIGKLLHSVVPVVNVPVRNVIYQFVDNCKNNKDTLLYYATHIEQYRKDFSVQDVNTAKLLTWISSPSNILLLTSFLEHPKVHVLSKDLKFKGPQIFRNTNIYITGRFIHGDDVEISSILSSYGATVVNKYDETVNCIVIGDIAEDVDSIAVKKALQNGIAVLSESKFFDTYEIDQDLKENLVSTYTEGV